MWTSAKRVSVVSLLVVFGGGKAGGLHAQTLGLVAGFVTSISVPAPTAAQYDAVPPANVSTRNTAPDFELHSTCLGVGASGCRIFLVRGAARQSVVLDTQYQVVTAVSCTGLVANTSLWTDVPTGPTQIASTVKNATCDAEFAFRVKNLSYSVQQAPATYLQDLTFIITRP